MKKALLLFLFLPILCWGQVVLQGVGKGNTYNITNDASAISAIINDSLDQNIRSVADISNLNLSTYGGYVSISTYILQTMQDSVDYLRALVNNLEDTINALYVPTVLWTANQLSLDTTTAAPAYDVWYTDDDSLSYLTRLRSYFFVYDITKVLNVDFIFYSKFSSTGTNYGRVRVKVSDYAGSAVTYDSVTVTGTTSYTAQRLVYNASGKVGNSWRVEVQSKMVSTTNNCNLYIIPVALIARYKLLRAGD